MIKLLIILSLSSLIPTHVIRVIDGDTIQIQNKDFTKDKVRFTGIDCPEHDQEWGDSATTKAKALLQNQSVFLKIQGRDRYNRILAEVFTVQNYQITSVNLQLVRSGNCRWYKHFAPKRRDYQLAEDSAKTEGLGLWRNKNATPPWKWRRKHKHH